MIDYLEKAKNLTMQTKVLRYFHKSSIEMTLYLIKFSFEASRYTLNFSTDSYKSLITSVR